MIDREGKLNSIWRMTHRDYRRMCRGERCILVLRDGGTVLLPLDELTDDEIMQRVGTGVTLS